MRTTSTIALTGVTALAGGATADLIGTEVVNVGDIGAGAPTYRLYLLFDTDEDNISAIYGDAQYLPLIFSSDTDLVQNCALEDSKLCDMDKGLDLGGDSWVNIGAGEPDTAFSPGFLGSDGKHSVIKGNFFSQPDNGGYFDQSIQTPVFPDEHGRILIAQFSLPESTTIATYQGTAYHATEPGASHYIPRPFSMRIVSCFGDIDRSGSVDLADLLVLLAAWGTSDGDADLSGNGLVDFTDLILLLEAWGPCRR